MRYSILCLALLVSACDQPPPQVIVQIKEVPVEVAAVPESPDGCKVNTTSNLVTEHTVSPIKNLIKVKGKDGPRNLCTVEFEIDIDGKTYKLTESEIGLEQQDSLCYYARERARKNLLLDIGGTFKSESNVNCKYHTG
jgi:hypothetical protein